MLIRVKIISLFDHPSSLRDWIGFSFRVECGNNCFFLTISAPPCLQYCTAELEKVVYHRHPKLVSWWIKRENLWLKKSFSYKFFNDLFMHLRLPSIKFYFFFQKYHTVKHRTSQRIRNFVHKGGKRSLKHFFKDRREEQGLITRGARAYMYQGDNSTTSWPILQA